MRTRRSFWALIRSHNQNSDITPRSLQNITKTSHKTCVAAMCNNRSENRPDLTYPQGPEEMCLSLEHVEHQNPSKTSEKMGYFDRVTVSLHIL